MSLLDYFRRPTTKSSASQAKERLQIIFAHERGSEINLPMLQKELITVISKYVTIDERQVKVDLAQDGTCAVLELNITLPDKRKEAASEIL